MRAHEPATAALIGAYEPAPNAAGLRALSPLAGASLVEHQAGRARAAGIGKVLLLGDRTNAGLQGAAARLRQDGIAIAIVEAIGDATDMLDPDDRVLLLADGCLPQAAQLQELVWAAAPALGVVADAPGNGAFERIDAHDRWAGMAILDRHFIADTAAMIGTWDPASTLVRRAVQDQAGRIATHPAPLLLIDPERLADAEQVLLDEARAPANDLVDQFVFKPTEQLALPLLLARGVEATALAGASAALAAGGGALALAGWRWIALACFLLSSLGWAAAARLARVRQRPGKWLPVLAIGRFAGAVLGAAGLARSLVALSHQWGWWLVSILLVGALVALRVEQRRSDAALPVWIASADTAIWLLLPFALVGRWAWGLAAITLYAGASFLWLYLNPPRDGAALATDPAKLEEEITAAADRDR